MRRIRIAGLCLVAVFALGALVVSAAQATVTHTEYVRCAYVGKKMGKYSESNCKTLDEKKGKLKGSYEWSEILPTCAYVGKKKGKYSESSCTTIDEKKGKLKGSYEKEPGNKITTSSGPSAIEAYTEVESGPNAGERKRQVGPGATVTCAASTGTGEITHQGQEGSYPDGEIHETIEFTGCKSDGVPCENAGPETIEIELKNLLEWSETGIQAHKLAAFVNNILPGNQVVEFTCGTGADEVTVEWERPTNAGAEVTPGVTPVVDRFETQEPQTDNSLTEPVEKIGGVSGWEISGISKRMWIYREGPGVPGGGEEGEAGLKSDQTITGDAGLEVRVN